ncbi:MAG: glycosyltransferase family 4 protein [Vicinamibacterales bacterium]
MAETVWPELTRTMPDARLTIVGASPPQAVLDLAARDSRVTVTGFVDDVRPYMEKAQVYLCPMRDGGGTRLKILDALSMGIPIVATEMALEGIDVVLRPTSSSPTSRRTSLRRSSGWWATMRSGRS